jgi:pimeloyl-ACP methyl ester carboxylesterase
MKRWERGFACLAVLSGILFLGSPSPGQVENLESDRFQVRDIVLGGETTGLHDFSATVTNRTDLTKCFGLDIRTECLGLGRVNWQSQYFYLLQPHETRKIEARYELGTPFLSRILLRFGESDRYFDREKWLTLSDEEQVKNPVPDIAFVGRKEILPKPGSLDEKTIREVIGRHEAFLNPVSSDRLSRIRASLPDSIRRRRTADPLRQRLRGLFQGQLQDPREHDYRTESWGKDYAFLESRFEAQETAVEVFSISGEGPNRISAFIASRKRDVSGEKPLIFLLSGNPPGTKESLAAASLFFAKLGYHAVAIDRRMTSRILDSKDKFLANLADPVNDVLRLIDYFAGQSKYRVSRMGLYGISAGAGEGEFVAALSDRLSAVALACGITSHEALFKNEGWFPTYSGMIIFPELGLGKPDIASLTSEQFWENFSKLKPEHNGRAHEIYRRLFPFFEDLDSLKAAPLIAPVPLIVVTGADDEQFSPEGAAQVDRAVQKAYKESGFPECSEFLIEPRTGHTVNSTAGLVIGAFFERWLK